MELRHLEAFVAVAEERNFTRAAAHLFIAQSGLSSTIRALERELRADLFNRTTRRVELTAAGAALLPEARRTLASAASAVQAVDSVEGLRRGTLRVGVMQTSGSFNVAALLARYRSAYPEIQIRLRQASSDDLTAMLLEGLLDVIFATATEDTLPGVSALLVARSPLVIIGPGNGGRRARAKLATVARGHLIGYPPGWGVRTLVDQVMRDAGVEPRVDLEVNDTTALLDLVEEGLGVAVVPAAMADLRPSLGRTSIADGRWEWVIAAQTLAPLPMNPVGRALWDMVKRRDQSP
jgi:DNA-binding transcriptional LysR family regulator